MRTPLLAIAAGFILLSAHCAVADSVVVNPDGSGDYLTIQSAMDWAPNYAQILIAAGTYQEALDHSSGKYFTLESLDEVKGVELIGDGSGSPVLAITSSSLSLKHLVFNGTTLGTEIGILNTGGGLTMQDCTVSGFSMRGISFRKNAYHLYAADSVISGNLHGLVVTDIANCAVSLHRCNFIGNGGPNTLGSGIFIGGTGQAMTFNSSIFSCNFKNNIGASGAAIYLQKTKGVNIYDCSFLGNASIATEPGQHGGAVAVREQEGDNWLGITNSLFVGNSMGGGGKGGAVAIWTDGEEETLSFWLRSSVLSGNTSDGGGGAVYVDVFQPGLYRINIEDSQLIGNSTFGDGGGLLVESVEGADLTNNYFCANYPNPAAGHFNDEGGNTFVDTCSAGACCVDDDCGEMTEEACSLAGGIWIGVGTTCLDVNCSEPITGACCLVRFCDVMGDNMCNLFGGEFHAFKTCSEVICDPLPLCPGDFNLDGEVNVLDLLGVIGAWGTCP